MKEKKRKLNSTNNNKRATAITTTGETKNTSYVQLGILLVLSKHDITLAELLKK